MAPITEDRRWSARWAVAAGLGLIVLAPGCRSNGDGATSTVGRSLRLAPRGETIPPAGLGVDLVKKRPEKTSAKEDATILPARTAPPEPSPF